jgi:hypothetical protein
VLVKESFEVLDDATGFARELCHLLQGVREGPIKKKISHVIDSNPALSFKLLSEADVSLLHPLVHQPHHLLSAGEPWMSESKVYRMDQAVIIETL